MDKKYLEDFIAKIEDLCKLDCCYDDFDFDMDEFELFFGYENHLGIIIRADDFENFSIFTSFPYYDFKKQEIEEHLYDEEELKRENRTHLEECFFRLYARDANFSYPLTVTDDGHYMCPGYVSRVGFFDIPYSDKIVSDFFNLLNNYWNLIGRLDNEKITREIIKLMCKEKGISADFSKDIQICRNTYIKLGEFQEENYRIVDEKYFGNEYFLFKCDGQTFSTEVFPVSFFCEIHDACTLFEEIVYLYNENKLQLVSGKMILTQTVMPDNGLFSNIEETKLIMHSSSFIPFGSEKFKSTFFENYSKLMSSSGKGPLIVTEGTTDWIHLKKHWELLKHTFPNIDLSFEEYYPPAKQFNGKKQLTMGGTVLLEMCNSYSKLDQSRVYIFIADCDDKKINKELGGNNCPYKKWSPNVYSMTLPIPLHRNNEDEICIEHLYTDEEIKQTFQCIDGLERRLYLGKDFDEYGRCLEEQKLCIKRNLCGANSIKVIDGTSECKVISIDSNDKRNYALSKFDFAEKIKPNPNSASFQAFRQVFEIINEIMINNRN